MPSSKYERELRFIDNEVRRMKMQLDALAEAMPADPAEAQEKARTVTELQDKIAGFLGRKAEIEDSFKAAGMELPDIGRSMNATVHNASGFEVHSHEEAESLASAYTGSAPAPSVRTETPDDITAQIKDIADELMSIEIRIMKADIDGDEAEMQKLRMMQSSLNARKTSLVQAAKEMKTEKPAPVSDADQKRLESVEADCRALRSQIYDLRSDLQNVKAQLDLIIEALGLEQ